MVLISLVCSNMATNIIKIIKTCKAFWLASEDFADFETDFADFESRRGESPRTPYHSFSFWSARKKTESKERARKRPELRGRNTNSSNHSMNSLRSTLHYSRPLTRGSKRAECFLYKHGATSNTMLKHRGYSCVPSVASGKAERGASSP